MGSFEIHQVITISVALINLDLETTQKFLDNVQKLFLNNRIKLTELLTFQVVSILMKRDFNKNVLERYINEYLLFIKNNQVKEKSIFILVSLMRGRLKSEKDSEIFNLLKKAIEEYKLYGNSLNKINQDSFKF
jgi:hypothetical protein